MAQVAGTARSMGIEVARLASQPRRDRDRERHRIAGRTRDRQEVRRRHPRFDRAAAAHPGRGVRSGQVAGEAQLRRDGRGRVPARGRPPQGRPDDPRHRLAARRHGQGRPGGGVRHRRRGPRGRGGRRRRRRRRRPRRPGPGGLPRLRHRHRHARPHGPGRPARPHPRPPRPHAQPQDRHGHQRRRQDRRPSSRPARSSTAPTGTATCTSRSARSSFDRDALLANYQAVLDEILRAKPAASKGRYIKGDHRRRRRWAPASASTRTSVDVARSTAEQYPRLDGRAPP